MAAAEAASAAGTENDEPQTPREVPSISLIDHTKPVDQDPPAELSRAPSSLAKTFTQGSIRQTLARRKYQRSKWQEGRGSRSDIPLSPTSPTVAEEGSGSVIPEDDVSGPSEPTTPAPTRPRAATVESSFNGSNMDTDTWGKGRARRTGRKVKDAIRGKQATKAEHHDPTSHVDILYENQRGFFFAGIPRFSSNSLLNFDPSAWLDGRFRPSAVNITNAQVPDPSWDWAWRCWYVDMSGDVDEEGWEYSFWFGKSAAWHGTHPWFHSFVRRRRWLRKRTKLKHIKTKAEGHALTNDYFTIHSKVLPPGVEDSDSITTSEKKTTYSSLQTSTAWGAQSWQNQADSAEVANVPDLLRGLRTAAVDREKIVLVRRFLDQAGEELHYLAEEMEHIMKLLVFQNSRRQLLSILMHEFEAAEKHRDEHEEKGEKESEEEKRRIDNLLKAVEAADTQSKALEYWSDVKDMARDGEILRASDHTHGWDHNWQGLDVSGPSPEGGSPSDSDDNEISEKPDKGKQPVRGIDEKDLPGDGLDGANELKMPDEVDTSRPSEDSARTEQFMSPMEEKTEAQSMQPASSPPAPPAPERRESEVTLEEYESAHSEPDDDEEDDAATERAPSEDEGDVDDHTPPGQKSPPTGATPIEALTQALNGSAKEDKEPHNEMKRPEFPAEEQRRSWIEQAFF